MTDVKRKWDTISKERRESLIKEIIAYFKTEKDQEIGVIAAEDLLDFFLEATYKAIQDSKNTIKQSLENIDIDLDLLLNK